MLPLKGNRTNSTVLDDMGLRQSKWVSFNVKNKILCIFQETMYPC